MLPIQQFKVDWDSRRGNVGCPVCNASLRYPPDYPKITHLATLTLLLYFLASSGVREGILASAKAVVIGVLGSIAIDALITRVKPPKLKLVSDDKGPPSLFGKPSG